MMSKEKRRVPKLRFPGFTEDWEQRKLDDIAKIKTGGGTPKTANPEYWSGNIPWIQSSDLVEGDIVHVNINKFINNNALKNSAAKLISRDSIALVTRVGVGKVAVINQDFTTSQDFLSLSDFDGNDIKFLAYQLYRLMQENAKVLQGTSIKGITKTELIEQSISIPSSGQEQNLISNVLSKIDSIITLHQRKLDNLKLKKKALLQKLFPKNGDRYPELRFPGFTDAWEQRKFKDIAFKRGKISEADLPYVEFEDINSGIGTLNKNISQKVGHKKGLLFEAGDVLFGKLRPYLQNWLLCQFAGIAVGDFWVLQPQNVSSAFLYYLIQSEAYQSVANISSGTKMPRSSWPLVSETLFSIPKYKEANMIGEFFLLIDRTITLHQRKLDHLQLQKKALLQQIFV